MTKSPRRLKEQVRDTVGEQVRDLPLHAVRLAMFGVGRALLLGDRLTRDYKEITEGGGVKPVIGRLRDDVQTTAEKVVGRVVERVRGEEAEPEPEPEPVRRTRPAGRTPAARTAGAEISVGKPGAEPRHAPKHARPGVPPKPAKPGALGRRHAKPADEHAGEGAPVAEPAPKPVPSEPKPEPAPQAEPAPSPEPAEAKKPADTGKPAPAEASDEATEKAVTEDEKAFEPKPENKPAAPAEAAHIAEDLPVPDYDTATLPQLRARLRGLSVEQVKLLREYERKHAGREDVIRMYERRIAKLNGLG
ncbi:hypothetical protein [Actinomadura bangladeshensis]|uniref:DUF8129 domain-containing protein n=1 Tax=Actinomadura bangladeshensis TaxID=453573 RepID=A0A4R4NQK4_9ACTN|nr:hypothetical protein [Actinomadura bangladeshensis]TDC11569.1 hypothetical protein E1284_27900 [Actinomadura bangladeshensis]